jgi:general secretion pathway protein K
VNELDRTRLVQNAALIADRSAESLQKLVDPQFGTLLQALVMERTLGGLLAITPAEFAQLVQAAGIEKINASLVDPKNVNRPFTDRSDTFRIRSSGRSGDVTTAIDAVVRLAAPAPGEPVAAPGRLIHWREE